MKLSFLQFTLGFVLGAALLVGGTAGAAYLVLSRLSLAPPRPTYQEDKTPQTEVATPPQPTTAPKPEAEPPQVAELPQEELPPGAYFARVTWPQGLSLRSEPNLEAERIGGVEYDTRIIILQESSDRLWQQIRTPGSEQEGWIKAGNVEKIE